LKDDQVQKVSAIVTNGTYSTTYQMPAQGEIAGHKIYGTVQETGTGQTLLAQQLSINYLSDKELKKQLAEARRRALAEFNKNFKNNNPKPKISSTPTLGCAKFVVFSIAGISLLCTLALPGSIMGLSGSMYSEIEKLLSVAVVSVIGLLITGTCLVFFVFLSKKFNNPQAGERVREWNNKRFYEGNIVTQNAEKDFMKIWNTGISRYQNAYYCFRDDIIFLPNEVKTESPSRFINFLFPHLE